MGDIFMTILYLNNWNHLLDNTLLIQEHLKNEWNIYVQFYLITKKVLYKTLVIHERNILKYG